MEALPYSRAPRRISFLPGQEGGERRESYLEGKITTLLLWLLPLLTWRQCYRFRRADISIARISLVRGIADIVKFLRKSWTIPSAKHVKCWTGGVNTFRITCFSHVSFWTRILTAPSALGAGIQSPVSKCRRQSRRSYLSAGEDAPWEYLCPISRELMVDPVTLSTGQTYDRALISKWINDGHYTCPVTGKFPVTNPNIYHIGVCHRMHVITFLGRSWQSDSFS